MKGEIKMNFIGKITDEDIGEEIIECINPKTRTAVRVILFNNENKIGILHKKNKNEYKLIGGGVDEGESLEEALLRETLEESGCIIDTPQLLGYIEEYRSKMNFKQTSYIYSANVKEDTKQLHLTQKEIDEGAEICWLTLEEALNYMTKCYDHLKASEYSSIYSTKIIIKRDICILKYYMNNK